MRFRVKNKEHYVHAGIKVVRKKFLSSMFVSQTGRVLEGVASDKGQSYPTWHQIWD